MFNSSSFGLVKVAYVADYGNFHIVPHAVKGLGQPSHGKVKCSINKAQSKHLTMEWSLADKRPTPCPGRLFLDVSY